MPLSNQYNAGRLAYTPGIALDAAFVGSLQSPHSPASQAKGGMTMTGVLIVVFFGIALVIGIYFLWVLLRKEMEGRPKPPPDTYDFGFGTGKPPQ
jgi:hypothetical protein